MLLSIIIPIYKVEKTIKACLDSIYSQGIDENLFSLILVNDGTPDKSVSLCYPYLKEHLNIRIIEQTNQGLSMARNNGLKQSEADYVWFVDSDDVLCGNSISVVLQAISNNISDCILLGHEEVDEGGEVLNKYCYEEEKELPGVDFLIENFNDCKFFIPAQFTVWRRSFLNKHHLYFYPSIYHEDCEFTPKAIFLSSSILCVKGIQYKYIRHNNTISTTISSKRAYDYVTVAQSLSKFSFGNGNPSVLCNFSALFINSAIKIILKCGTKEQILFWKYLLGDYRSIQYISNYSTGKYRLISNMLYALTMISKWI